MNFVSINVESHGNDLSTYLSTTSGVLSSTTGDQLGIARKQVLVDTHVLVLGEDSIIGLETVFLQESDIATCSVSIPIHHLSFSSCLSIPTSLDVYRRNVSMSL